MIFQKPISGTHWCLQSWQLLQQWAGCWLVSQGKLRCSHFQSSINKQLQHFLWSPFKAVVRMNCLKFLQEFLQNLLKIIVFCFIWSGIRGNTLSRWLFFPFSVFRLLLFLSESRVNAMCILFIFFIRLFGAIVKLLFLNCFFIFSNRR
jgi:hypothetical protein